MDFSQVKKIVVVRRNVLESNGKKLKENTYERRKRYKELRIK